MKESPGSLKDGLEELRQLLAQRQIDQVLAGIFDLNGTLRGKRLSVERFLGALEGGFHFGSIPLCWDAADVLIDGLAIYDTHPGLPDFPARLLPSTSRPLPYEPGTLLCLVEYAGPGAAYCPRTLLRRTAARLRERGYEAMAGIEYEFAAFEESELSCRTRDFRNLMPHEAPGYSAQGTMIHSEFHNQLVRSANAMNLAVESFHPESGSLEVALAPAPALEAADRGAVFKTLAKVVAQRSGKLVTFMARLTPDCHGQGGHVHLSLKDAFQLDPETNEMSAEMRSFLAGCQQRLPELTAMLAPNVNSYARFHPNHFIANQLSWGLQNRTCAVRVIPGAAARLEVRLPGADANPYLVLAAVLAAGLDGIERGLEPTPPMEGNSYDQPMDPEFALPMSLGEAARALKASGFARECFGDVFVDHFAHTRDWEQREFRRQVTEWERRRYLLWA